MSESCKSVGCASPGRVSAEDVSPLVRLRQRLVNSAPTSLRDIIFLQMPPSYISRTTGTALTLYDHYLTHVDASTQNKVYIVKL